MKKDAPYIGKEDDFLVSVFDYLRLKHPKVLACHIANEGISGSKAKQLAYGAKKKRQGKVAGMPDVMIFKQFWNPITDELSGGLALELKVYKKDGKTKNYPSKAQKAVHEKLRDAGWKVEVIWSLDTAIMEIDNYLI